MTKTMFLTTGLLGSFKVLIGIGSKLVMNKIGMTIHGHWAMGICIQLYRFEPSFLVVISQLSFTY